MCLSTALHLVTSPDYWGRPPTPPWPFLQDCYPPQTPSLTISSSRTQVGPISPSSHLCETQAHPTGIRDHTRPKVEQGMEDPRPNGIWPFLAVTHSTDQPETQPTGIVLF